MTYYVEPSMFYWIEVFNSVKLLAGILMVVAFIGTVIVLLAMNEVDEEDEEDKAKCLHYAKITIAVLISTTLLFIFVPTKKTCIEMMIAKNITVENVNTTIDGTRELIDYIFDKVNGK